jgi:hypothetical protein
MAGFLNLRDVGGIALKAREESMLGVVRWRAELPHAGRARSSRHF